MSDVPGARALTQRSALVAGLAAGAGFLTRPCCVPPARLAFGGTGWAALTQRVAASFALAAAPDWFSEIW
jgi:hypothetical protein